MLPRDVEMKELLRSNDTVRLGWLTVFLADAGIESAVLDTHTSVLEGSVGAIPRRLVVADGDYAKARRMLQGAGESLPEAADDG
jgi:hypothetical protein